VLDFQTADLLTVDLVSHFGFEGIISLLIFTLIHLTVTFLSLSLSLIFLILLFSFLLQIAIQDIYLGISLMQLTPQILTLFSGSNRIFLQGLTNFFQLDNLLILLIQFGIQIHIILSTLVTSSHQLLHQVIILYLQFLDLGFQILHNLIFFLHFQLILLESLKFLLY
jgi:flagellar biosynthesis protein FlhB